MQQFQMEDFSLKLPVIMMKFKYANDFEWLHPPIHKKIYVKDNGQNEL